MLETLIPHRISTSESESSSSIPSPSSVFNGLNPSLLLPRISPTFQFFPLLDELAPIIVPFPLFLHLLQARHIAINIEIGTEMAAATSTEELTSAGYIISRPLLSLDLDKSLPVGEDVGMEDGILELN